MADKTAQWLTPILLVLALGTCIYFCTIDHLHAHLYGDEYHSVKLLDKPYGELMGLYDQYGTGIPLLLLQKLSVDLFGAAFWVYRLPAMLGAIATLVIVYFAARRLVGPVPAVIATLALSMNSMHIFYSRFGRSYSLVVFFAVLSVYALIRILAQERPRFFWHFILALSVALLPYFHLTTVSFVAAVFLAATSIFLLEKKSVRQGCWMVSSFVAGTLVCFALYLPAWESLMIFIHDKAGHETPPFNMLNVVILFGGNYGAALIWMIGVPVASIWLLFKKRSSALLVISAVLIPIPVLMIVKPTGMTYAYARYSIASLPFALMLLAWMTDRLLALLRPPSRIRDSASLVIGAALVSVAFLTGPMGVKGKDDGPFANSQLSLMPMPAFDIPWKETPRFYERISDYGEKGEIFEFPVLLTRMALLYRNYYLQHGWDMTGLVSTSSLREMEKGLETGVMSLEPILESDADYLVFHLNINREVKRYWKFVFQEAWPSVADPALKSQMMSLMMPRLLDAPLLKELASDISGKLGKPVYHDSKVIVWKTR
jgi:hypothetical protein